MNLKIIERIGWLFVFWLVGIGVYVCLGRYLLPSSIHSFLDPLLYGSDWLVNQAPNYDKSPFLTFFHVVPGSLFMILGPLQFSKKLRSSYLNFHRWVGRIYSVMGAILVITALYLGFAIPFAGPLERVPIIFFAALFSISLFKGIYHIRKLEIAKHREWMIRAFAIGLGISTFRVYYFIFLHFTSIPAHEFFITAGWSGFTTNLVMAEIWINLTRTQKTQNILLTQT